MCIHQSGSTSFMGDVSWSAGAAVGGCCASEGRKGCGSDGESWVTLGMMGLEGGGGCTDAGGPRYSKGQQADNGASVGYGLTCIGVIRRSKELQ